MSMHVSIRCECHVADAALERTLTRMHQHMPIQRAHGTKNFSADLASVHCAGDFVGGIVRSDVFGEVVVVEEVLTTHWTLELVLT